ncbi:MAG: hypothetical protein LBI03_09780 [Clostridiales bacterium]|jgi:hypothetical protein|nr:hypothetical protein [Clostridiales bacterium]
MQKYRLKMDFNWITPHEKAKRGIAMAEKKIKPKIETVAQELLDGEMLNGFNELINFLKSENISLLWTSFNGWNANYEGKRVGKLYFRNGKSFYYIVIDTVNCFKDDYDTYLEGQPGEIVDMLLERVSHQCVHCRPTCSCSHSSGKTVQIFGKRYKNACVNSTVYCLNTSSGDTKTMTLEKPCAGEFPEGTPIERAISIKIPMETVKKLILARKAYIAKTVEVKK